MTKAHLIRLASELPPGSGSRRLLLAALKKNARPDNKVIRPLMRLLARQAPSTFFQKEVLPAFLQLDPEQDFQTYVDTGKVIADLLKMEQEALTAAIRQVEDLIR